MRFADREPRVVSAAGRVPEDYRWRGEQGFQGAKTSRGNIEEECVANLRGAKWVSIVEKMVRSDPQCQAVELVHVLPITGAKWILQPADESAAAKRICNLVHEVYFEAPPLGMTTTWHDHLREALLCPRYGYSVHEKVWQDAPIAGYLRYRKFTSRSPATMQAHPDGAWELDPKDNSVKGIRQYQSTDNGVKDKTIPIANLLVFTHREEFGNPEGWSIFRAAYKPWLAKDPLIRIMGIGYERQAVPFTLAGLPTGTEGDEQVKVEKLLRNLRIHEEMGGTYFRGTPPNDVVLTELGGKFDGTKIIRALDWCNSEIARAGLAHFLMLGQTDVGTYALSEDQTTFFLMSLMSLARYVASVHQYYAIPDLVRVNFGESALPLAPKLICERLGSRNQKAFAETLALLLNAKAVTAGLDIEERAREHLDLPPPPDDLEEKWAAKEEASKALLQQLPQAQGAAQAQQQQVQQPPNLPPGQNPQGGNGQARKASERIDLADAPKWRRDLTRWEKGVKFVDLQRNWDTAEERWAAELKAIGEEQGMVFAASLAEAIRNGDLDAIAQASLSLRGRYSETIRDLMWAMVEQSKLAAARELGLEAKPATPRQTRQWVSATADAVADTHAARWQSAGTRAAIRGVMAGLPAADVLANVRQALGDSITRETRLGAEATVAPSVNYGRDAAARAADLQGMQFSAILDTRTCPLCQELDTMQITEGDPRYEQYMPPLHDRCRCCWVFIHKEEEGFKVTWQDPSAELVAAHGNLAEMSNPQIGEE